MQLVQDMEHADDRDSEGYVDKLEQILELKLEGITSLRKVCIYYLNVLSPTLNSMCRSFTASRNIVIINVAFKVKILNLRIILVKISVYTVKIMTYFPSLVFVPFNEPLSNNNYLTYHQIGKYQVSMEITSAYPQEIVVNLKVFVRALFSPC